MPARPACRLSDGQVLSATTIKTVRKHDLTVLKIEAVDLRVVQWSRIDDLPVGTLVGVASASPKVGFVSRSTLSLPPEHGWLRAELRDSKQGLEVTKLEQVPQGSLSAMFGPQLLHNGDILLSIDGQATPNHAAYLALLEIEKNDPIAIAGDQVRLGVTRNGKQMEFPYVLGASWPRFAGQSACCSGFSRVYSVAASPEFDMCGGPVFDREGQAVGIAIAGRQKGWLLVLPDEIAKSAIAN